jgi:hypothetical protein
VLHHKIASDSFGNYKIISILEYIFIITDAMCPKRDMRGEKVKWYFMRKVRGEKIIV